MQEIGPRFTLKLRWIKKDSLATGRRKVGGQIVQGEARPEGEETMEVDGGVDVKQEGSPEEEGVDEAMRAAVEAVDRSQPKKSADNAATKPAQPPPPPPTTSHARTDDQNVLPETGDDDTAEAAETKSKKKRRRLRTTSPTTGRIVIPTIEPGPVRDGLRKKKKPRSILDSFSLVGGVDDSAKEFAWKVSVGCRLIGGTII
jgi:ribosome production factor 1